MASASFNGRRVVYGEVGSGRAVVLIHGSFSTSSAWKRVIGTLDLDAHRALAPDLPGWGESDPLPEDCPDLAQYHATAVEAVVSHATVDRIHLVAHSYGAVVALTMAIAGRVPIRALTLFEPLPLGLLTQTGDQEAFDQVERFVRDYRNAFDGGDQWAARHVIDLWGGLGTFDAMSPTVRAATAAGTAQNLRDWKANLGFRPSLEACRSIRAPSIVAIGQKANPIARLVSTRLCDLMPGSTFAEIPAAGHFRIHTHASESARLIGQDVSAADGNAERSENLEGHC